ncbi:YdeI/OmpD-associated family protein [Roseivirga sp. BDSF3-8]|uniref:YdeI/OmpD-associated family protein n=1 Tax=Roseivirga sp. BDSF3-8 TaxID=3241598 RepID=UPI0035325CEF
MASFTSTLTYFHDNPVYGHHIPVPRDHAEPFTSLNEKRVLCTLQGKVTIHAALMHDGKGDYFILANKTLRNKLGLSLGQDVKVSLETDNSPYGMEVPEELTELFSQDEEADNLFHSLTSGKQRSLIHWVSSVKNPDLRLKRGLVMTRHLKSSQGKLDWKKLNQELKDANNL